jgi:mRNA-degrading endonuclease RelE of RelBE toxin-antitoxin system
MVREITLSPKFIKETKNLDKSLKTKLKKQIEKIINNPEIGKPLKYLRGERTVYVKPFRIIYSHIQSEDKIIFLKFEHRKSVYD